MGLISAFLPYLQTPCNDTHAIVQSNYSLPTDANLTPQRGPQTTVTAMVDNGWTDDDLPLISASEAENMYVL